jgi:hypothetical protein
MFSLDMKREAPLNERKLGMSGMFYKLNCMGWKRIRIAVIRPRAHAHTSAQYHIKDLIIGFKVKGKVVPMLNQLSTTP